MESYVITRKTNTNFCNIFAEELINLFIIYISIKQLYMIQVRIPSFVYPSLENRFGLRFTRILLRVSFDFLKYT